MEKLILTAAVTGGLPIRAQNPNIPYTPHEIAAQAIESYEAGASVVHLHVRDPETGRPSHKAALFEETIGLIRERCDIIINTSTGGGPGVSPEERIGIIPSLSSNHNLKPEMASLNCGSVNFGLLDSKTKEWVINDVQINKWTSIHQFAQTMKAHGVKPELEVFEAGMIHNACVLQSIDALDSPLHFQFVLGALGGMQATVDNVVFLKNSIPAGSTWSICVMGVDIFSVGPVAIAAGGNVRIGLEDCLYISPGVPASGNAQLVNKMVKISREMGREIATPAEARRILNL